jgi:hypothetical protein
VAHHPARVVRLTADGWNDPVMLFNLRSDVLAVAVFVTVIGATAVGLAIGWRIRARSDEPHDSVGVLQGALLGFMALVLAFGLTLAVGRYESRRASMVAEATALSTTYLRAETLAEPMRSDSLGLLEEYTELGIVIADTKPESAAATAAIAASDDVERELWRLAGQALDDAPQDTAPRLYVESLNESFDSRVERVAGLANRVPTPVLVVEVTGAALALALLGLHLAVLGRGALVSMLAAVLVGLLLVVTFDLDRPTRGLITVPDSTLRSTLATMQEGPVTGGPDGG